MREREKRRQDIDVKERKGLVRGQVDYMEAGGKRRVGCSQKRDKRMREEREG